MYEIHNIFCFSNDMILITILAFESLAGIACENSGLSSLHVVLAPRSPRC